MIRPATETTVAALLIAAAASLLLFGPDGLVTLAYRCFPPGLRSWLREAYPPQLAHVDPDARLGIAAVVLMAGAWFAAGLLGAYPDWRNNFLALTGILLVGVVVTFMLVF